MELYVLIFASLPLQSFLDDGASYAFGRTWFLNFHILTLLCVKLDVN